MYLPQDSGEGGEVSKKRQEVLDAFKSYSEVVHERVMPKFNATWHWAKLEVPRSSLTGQLDEVKMDQIRKRLSAKFPLELFNAYRAMLDPKNILANQWIDSVIPR